MDELILEIYDNYLAHGLIPKFAAELISAQFGNESLSIIASHRISIPE